MRRLNRCYLTILFAAVSIMLVTMFMFNLLIDPFLAYRVVEIESLKFGKRRLAPGMAEDYLARRPEQVLFGTSRVGMGFEEKHPAWANDRVMKVILYGSRWYEQSQMLRFMLDQDRRPRRIIYGLDFFAFADDQPGVGVGNFDKSRFSPDYNPWTYHAQNLVSMYAINESYKVIESALTGVKQAVDPNAAVGELGNGYMFAHTLWSAAQPPRAGAQQRIVDSLESFEQILRRARRANVTMTIVFLPTHVLHQEALHRSGKGELIEAWKRRVTLIAQRVGEGDIELWDFENYNPVTTETVPPIGDLKHSMHWHYDSVHFTPEVGKTILDQLLDYSRDKSNELNLVGVRLMPDNIDEYLATVRYQRQAYQIDRSDQIAFLDKILSIPPPRTAR